MTLQLKFAFLLASLAAAVMLALGAARWTLDVTYREVREPVQSASNVLRLLVDIESEVDALRGMLDRGDSFRAPHGDEPQHPLDADLAALVAATDRIDSLQSQVRAEQWVAYAGRGVFDNFRYKIAEFRKAAQARFADGPIRPDGELSASLFQLHELLKKMERRVVIDIQTLAEASETLRIRLGIVLGLALFLVLLTGALAFLLVRRWVVRPVAGLRAAAARIGAGDFEHRIPIPAGAPRDEITSLSAEVNHMAAMVKQLQAKRIEQERLATVGAMLRTIAHNIRNPLSGIRGLAEYSRREAADAGPAASEIREFQDRIIAAVDQFGRWLTDFLDSLNPARPTPIRPQATNPTAWLPGLIDAHRPQAESSGVRLELDQSDGPERATIDAGNLEHALSAILSNAIQASAANSKHTPNPMVRLTSRCIRNGDRRSIWELRVEDVGPGVPEDLREKIFEPLFTTKPGGTGIGLAVAQKVVRAHGGSIRVEDPASSATGTHRTSGAVFVIHLPLEDGPDLASEAASKGQ